MSRYSCSSSKTCKAHNAVTGLILATLSTNIAANVVPVANALVNLAPQRISFATGGVIASLVGIAIRPWLLIANTQGFIYTWCERRGCQRAVSEASWPSVPVRRHISAWSLRPE